MSAWYVVHTKPHAEDRVISHLHRQGYASYCPRYSKRHRHARVEKTVLAPLFPGYVFVQMDLPRQSWSCINSTPGVLHVVGSNGGPTPLPPGVVTDIQSRETEAGSVTLEPPRTFKGDACRIQSGPFAGFVGVFERIADDHRRVVLLLKLLGQQVRINAPVEALIGLC